MRTRGFMGVGYGSICSVGDNNRVVDLYGVFVMMVAHGDGYSVRVVYIPAVCWAGSLCEVEIGGCG